MSRDQRPRADVLEDQLIAAKFMARRLFQALAVRVDVALDVLFDGIGAGNRFVPLHGDLQRAIDVAYDAAETVWERHRIRVTPVRRILDGGPYGSMNAGPPQDEGYIVTFPNGGTQNVTRAQLLMMAGMDADA
ncbi:MAG: hypothetical protein V3V60_15830 [Sphingomonas aquatilis]|uniref:hypothetical protein n=1 Tax=Sphingomonas aquatilis TaxID=93063 RepID=UPI002F2EE7EE